METSTIKENPPSIMSIDDDDTQDTEQEEEKYNEYDDDSDDEIFYLEDDEDEDDGGVIANQHHIHKMVDVANQYLKGLFFKYDDRKEKVLLPLLNIFTKTQREILGLRATCPLELCFPLVLENGSIKKTLAPCDITVSQNGNPCPLLQSVLGNLLIGYFRAIFGGNTMKTQGFFYATAMHMDVLFPRPRAVPPMLRTLLPDVSTETIRACLGVCLGNQEGVVEMLQTQDYSVEHLFYTTCSGDPTQEAFLIHLAQYMHRRLLVLTDFCIVCDSKHAMSTTKLLPCSKELCTSSVRDFGWGDSLLHELKTNTQVVDLLICLANAAAKNTKRRDLLFDSFPPDLVTQTNVFDYDALCQVLGSLSTLPELANCASRKDMLNIISPLQYACLNWIVNNNRCSLFSLPNSKKIQGLPDDMVQFVMSQTTPEKEANFQALKASHGSEFAFHGSNLENFFSIIRDGLKNASGTEYQINGAAHGRGIYLARDMQTSLNYATNHTLWKHSMLAQSHVFCMAICEVICGSSINNDSTILVVPDETRVTTRFFLLGSKSSIVYKIKASDLVYPQEYLT